MIECLVCEFDAGDFIQNGPKNVSGLVRVASAMRQNPPQKFGSYHDFRIPVVREFLENCLRLIVDLLSHVRFADAKFSLDRLRRVGITIHRCLILGASCIESPCLKEILRQQ